MTIQVLNGADLGLDPGGWSHTSAVLRDLLAGLNAPPVEGHVPALRWMAFRGVR
jgi:3-dehydroquinate dehydratase